jgi:hypothetical protein
MVSETLFINLLGNLEIIVVQPTSIGVKNPSSSSSSSRRAIAEVAERASGKTTPRPQLDAHSFAP